MAAATAQCETSATELQGRVQLLEQRSRDVLVNFIGQSYNHFLYRLKDTEMSDGDHVQAVLKEVVYKH